MDLIQAADALNQDLAPLNFGPPVTHVYNPLLYARESYRAYFEAYGQAPKETILVGMNPGPWGMAQTGIPFGDPLLVKEWLGIEASVGKPEQEHPKRPVLGLASERREVSGTRLWSAARDAFGSPARFFARFFVANYCPLCFLEESGRNRTPDRLPAREREPLFAACDRHLRRVVQALTPRLVVGIGAFAAARAEVALADLEVEVAQILHPSPASPAANRGWDRRVRVQLQALGVCACKRPS
jgi:single-strand selective monofunctional uracil DNA glycosylase